MACFIFSAGVGGMETPMILSGKTPKGSTLRPMERIEFDVKWSFIPLIETYMETFLLPNKEGPALYVLTHQAAMNTFWNDRMESIVSSESLLPSQMETIIKEREKDRKEIIVFQRNLGRAQFYKQDGDKETVFVEAIDISENSMDPLSAFYCLRKKLGPEYPKLELEGITGSRRFILSGELQGEQRLTLPVGTFKTYRIECNMQYWTMDQKDTKTTSRSEQPEGNRFTMWITEDHHRFPLQIRYHLPLGSLWIRASSLKHYDSVS